MMDEMVERVAKAICERNHALSSAFAYPWDETSEEMRDWYRDLADAAIKALQTTEPRK
jgi:hypothetical protein